MKSFLSKVSTVATVILVALFVTLWCNILIPTVWEKEVLDYPLLFGWSVRSIITYLLVLVPCILLKKPLGKHSSTVLLAALLPVTAAIFKWCFYGGKPWPADEYTLVGVMLVWICAMLMHCIFLENIYRSLSVKDIIQDFLFSTAIAILLYGLTVVLNLNPFSFNVYGALLPIVGFALMVLAKQYHQPKYEASMYQRFKTKKKHPKKDVPIVEKEEVFVLREDSE